MTLARFGVLIHEFLNKDSDVVPEEASLIVLDSKYGVCMDKNGKYNNHTSHISRKVHCKESTLYNGMEKTEKFTIFTSVREVYNRYTLPLRMLVIMI